MSYPRAYAYKRGDWYWVHQSVPYRLRDLIGRLSFQYSLDTKDEAEAKSKVEVYQQHFDGLFTKAEVRLNYLKLDEPTEEKLLEVASWTSK